MNHHRRRSLWQLGVGIFLVVSGCALLLGHFDVLSIRSAWHFWPLIVITVGLGRLAEATDARDRQRGIFWTLIGSWLLAAELHLFGITYHNSWPIVLIVFGVSILLRSGAGHARHTVITENSHRPDRASILAPRLIVGLGIIAIGVIFLLGNLDIADTHRYLRYWPVILILLGAAYMLQSANVGGRIWGAILAFVGAGILFDHLGYWDFNVWSLWPLILVFVGGSMIMQSSRRRGTLPATDDTESYLKGFAVMSGFRRTVSTQEFSGGELSAVMGGAEIDLRQAAMKGDEAVLDVFAFWGGIDMKVPESWTVVVKAMPFMGGIEDKTSHPTAAPQKRLIITGTAIMGGVEIRN